MVIFKCKMCGGTIEFNQGDTVGICDSCGTKQTLPRLDDDKKANLYDRANHFRRNNDYDKAMGIYEQILNEDNTDSEAYWSLVLCRYGIEYVEDPSTHKRVPTVNRAQFTSIFDDDNYKQALHYADSSQRVIYEQEATLINEIQKGILAISQKEEPFDVFICYKETDNNGRRTQDSVLANDLYHQLTQEGFKVFFSRITLEDKLGTAYEPYIFAALNSAKVMVVIGTRPENFNAVWVKNEWSRFLALVKNDSSKVLIPAYRDMDPYELPEEFSHLQAQDMSKLGFMQDLIRGIKKITDGNTGVSKSVNKEAGAVSTGNGNVDSLLKRVFMFLEDGNWSEADAYCERVLDINPECGEAYLGKLMAEFEVTKREKLADMSESMKDKNNFSKAVRFGDDKLKAELDGYEEAIENKRKQGIYDRAKDMMQAASSEEEYEAAAYEFETILSFKDSEEFAKECHEKAEERNTKDSELANAIIKAFDNGKKAETLRELKEKQQKLNRLYEDFTEFEQNLKEASERLSDNEREYEAASKNCSKFERERDELRTQKNTLEDEIAELQKVRANLGLFARKKKKETDDKFEEYNKHLSVISESLKNTENKATDYKEKRDYWRGLRISNRKTVENCKSKLKGYSSKESVEKNLNEIAEKISEIEAALTGSMSIAEAKERYYAFQKAVDKKKPALRFLFAPKGGIVEFGLYPQQQKEKKEPIKWIVLEKQEDRVLLISQYALDCKEYNEKFEDITWENCTLRKWLNKEFIETAFSKEEKRLVSETINKNADNGEYNIKGGNDTLDKVFLLSIGEAEKYFSSDDARKCKLTDYALSKKKDCDNADNCWWWLRSPGWDQDDASCVSCDGEIGPTGNGVHCDFYDIRPALWINLNTLGMSMAEAKTQFSASENIREAVLKKNSELRFIFAEKEDIAEFGSYPQQQEGKRIAISIIKEKCIGCGQCFKACPQDAFEFEPYSENKLGKVAKINTKCTFCNQCLTACIFGAIENGVDYEI